MHTDRSWCVGRAITPPNRLGVYLTQNRLTHVLPQCLLTSISSLFCKPQAWSETVTASLNHDDDSRDASGRPGTTGNGGGAFLCRSNRGNTSAANFTVGRRTAPRNPPPDTRQRVAAAELAENYRSGAGLSGYATRVTVGLMAPATDEKSYNVGSPSRPQRYF